MTFPHSEDMKNTPDALLRLHRATDIENRYCAVM